MKRDYNKPIKKHKNTKWKSKEKDQNKAKIVPNLPHYEEKISKRGTGSLKQDQRSYDGGTKDRFWRNLKERLKNSSFRFVYRLSIFPILQSTS